MSQVWLLNLRKFNVDIPNTVPTRFSRLQDTGLYVYYYIMKNTFVYYSPQEAAIYSLLVPGVNKMEALTIGLANPQNN